MSQLDDSFQQDDEALVDTVKDSLLDKLAGCHTKLNQSEIKLAEQRVLIRQYTWAFTDSLSSDRKRILFEKEWRKISEVSAKYTNSGEALEKATEELDRLKRTSNAYKGNLIRMDAKTPSRASFSNEPPAPLLIDAMAVVLAGHGNLAMVREIMKLISVNVDRKNYTCCRKL